MKFHQIQDGAVNCYVFHIYTYGREKLKQLNKSTIII